MCRSIKTLRRADAPASQQELHEAALQYVRKISGYRVPSRANAAPFETAVAEITAASARLLTGLNSNSLPRASPSR
ncbi:MAG TPA: DUF2277 domain-containing protein [Candidatus Limnocylindrales bacterium]|nr:DUF2277 domain-containing protein [Candidatus Limnocylindrales bacterium]